MMNMTAQSGVALVTGAGRRIGRAIAIGLARDGHKVAVHYNGSDHGAREAVACVESLGGHAVAFRHDLTETAKVDSLIDQAVTRLGPVNVLVNSASLFNRDNLEALALDSWRGLMDVNLAAPVFLMQAFARQQPVPSNAAIINILDTQMIAVNPGRFSYFCAKFALDGATRLAALDLAKKNITVNAIAPGLVLPSGSQTDDDFVNEQKRMPLGEGLGTDDIVDAVRYLISARHVTGHTLVVDSGQHMMGMGNMNN